MEDEVVMPRARYEAPRDDNSWMVLLAAAIATIVAGYILTRQAYVLPLGDLSVMQALGQSAGAIAIRIVPLALIGGAALWFLMTRLGRPRVGPLAAVVVTVGALAGSGLLVGLTALEKAEYIKDNESLRRPPSERIAARYQQALFHSYNAFNGRLDNLFQFRVSYRSSPGDAEDIERARRGLETARQAARNFESAVADNQARALADVERTNLSRFGKASARAELQEVFDANAPTVERIVELNGEILDQIEAQVEVLEGSLGRWNLQYGMVAFRNQSDLNAFRTAGERLPELTAEATDLVRQLGVQAAEASGPSA